MQIKPQITSHLLEWLLSKREEITMFTRMWRKGNTCELLVGMQIGAATMENSIKVLQKIKNSFTI